MVIFPDGTRITEPWDGPWEPRPDDRYVPAEHQQRANLSVARGVGPALGNNGAGERQMLTGLAIMAGTGLLLLLLTHKSRRPGFLTFNSCRNC